MRIADSAHPKKSLLKAGQAQACLRRRINEDRVPGTSFVKTLNAAPFGKGNSCAVAKFDKISIFFISSFYGVMSKNAQVLKF